MTFANRPDPELERRISARLLDVLIRAGIVLALVLLCYQVFFPFASLMVWALILAVSLYPLQQMVALRLRGRQGWASGVLVLVTLGLIVVPARC